LIVDFAPHRLEFLREAHRHRRLGFSDAEITRWLADAGLESAAPVTLPAKADTGLTVKIWTAARIEPRIAA
jgi:ArsR family transcriptional regulator